MTWELKDYQKKAVKELFDEFKIMLKSSESGLCVFQAPTGSGKTVTVADLLKKLVRAYKDQLSFVWIAPRKLHDQSKDKLERIYEHDQLLNCSNFEDLQDNIIGENEILFFNWESIVRADNIYIRENEQDRNLSTVRKNTKENKRKLILIIDESHYAAEGEKAKILIDQLDPDITLEVSATPHLTSEMTARKIKVSLKEVIEEEMIKNEILVNPEFLKIKVEERSGDNIVIDEALKKRNLLKKGFKKEGSNVNPLILIQLPDKKAQRESKLEEVVKILKDEHDITVENGKLAVWLSEEKSNTLPNIEKRDNEVEVLIFKQAIALGWDCPRASILVMFRETKSSVFTIQTIGRIMRMPEPDIGYYETPELNKGYVFTNLADITLARDWVGDFVSIYTSFRDDTLYKEIKLRSLFLKRQRERNRLSGGFSKIFARPSITEPLKSKINKNPAKIIKPILSDGLIPNIDNVGEIETKGQIDVKLTSKEMRESWNDFITVACSPYAFHDSSNVLKRTLYRFLKNELDIEDWDKSQLVILGKENFKYFLNAIDEAKAIYKTEVVDKISEEREEVVNLEWGPYKIMDFHGMAEKSERKKSIMKPFYSKKEWETENNFMTQLDASDKVEWWYKNGESEIKYFSVPYTNNEGKKRLFFVDFVIQFKDGIIGLFDTKGFGTWSNEKAGPRHDGLYSYIQAENKNGKKLVGGIAVKSPNGTWKYNDKKEYDYDENNPTYGWKVIDL